ncbi:hypothetical protein [Streptomyces sp. NPDC086023]|uniref:hypothetical protein n=1 Tax=Streptomyces sp. NPDC086023 TaxID=3365746 RepID=UPI0037CF9219
MDVLAGRTGAGTGEWAGVLAEAACHLHDAVGATAWGGEAAEDAIEDAIEAVETTALALGSAHPDAEAVLAPLHAALGELRRRLGLRTPELLSGTEALPAPRRSVGNPRRSRLGAR